MQATPSAPCSAALARRTQRGTRRLSPQERRKSMPPLHVGGAPVRPQLAAVVASGRSWCLMLFACGSQVHAVQAMQACKRTRVVNARDGLSIASLLFPPRQPRNPFHPPPAPVAPQALTFATTTRTAGFLAFTARMEAPPAAAPGTARCTGRNAPTNGSTGTPAPSSTRLWKWMASPTPWVPRPSARADAQGTPISTGREAWRCPHVPGQCVHAACVAYACVCYLLCTAAWLPVQSTFQTSAPPPSIRRLC